jgi:uncharacterized membrane protein
MLMDLIESGAATIVEQQLKLQRRLKMKEDTKAIMEKLRTMRNTAFTQQDQQLHKLLGRVMAAIIDVREHLESKPQ